MELQKQLQLNFIHQGHVLEKLREIPDKSVNCVVTSPPYWGLRVYHTEPQIWGGNAECPHQWQTVKRRLER